MKPRRIKPRVAVTVDADVAEWLRRESAKRRLKVSQYVNQLLGQAKAEDEKRGPLMRVAEPAPGYTAARSTASKGHAK